MEMITNSAEETKVLASKIAKQAFPNTVIVLYGNLGAGKTTFTQGFAKGLEIKRTVSSPTFTILKVYQGTLPLYHIDAYRLEGSNQDLGFEDLLYDDGVTVIEWPEYIKDLLPKEYLEIHLDDFGEGKRKIILKAHGEAHTKLLEGLQ